MYEPRIILSGAPNARDLGGLETRGGKTLKKTASYEAVCLQI